MTMIKATFPIFIIFLLISPAMHSAISEGVCMEKAVKENDTENTERLVDHIIVFPYSQPIPLQMMDLLLYCYLHRPFFGGMVRFGTVDFYDITDEEPITVHANFSVIWEDNHTVLDSYSCKYKISANSSDDLPGGFGYAPAALFEDVCKKVKTPVGHYTLRIELYVEEDNSSKIVEIPGVMFYYICMLSTGPFLLTGLKVYLSYIPWANEHLHDFIYSNVWDP
ncbi:MAG: hypothetical protein DRN19_02300 [Thermoplasmata archaeon]|nr:MAG: hypothetical protein DRN19_02300 [Thermoplasmata archaeon]